MDYIVILQEDDDDHGLMVFHGPAASTEDAIQKAYAQLTESDDGPTDIAELREWWKLRAIWTAPKITEVRYDL